MCCRKYGEQAFATVAWSIGHARMVKVVLAKLQATPFTNHLQISPAVTTSFSGAMHDSTSPQSTAPDEPSADVVLNRHNVALARSRRILQSWLPPAPPAEAGAHEELDMNDDDDDAGTLNEVGGMGSRTGQEDVDAFGLPRKKHSTNDKLLEQIMGKRGAEAKRKQNAKEGKAAVGSRHGKTLPLVEKPKQEKKRAVESDDDDEGGRATAFKSRKMRSVVVPREIAIEALDREDIGQAATGQPIDASTTLEPADKPSKRKTNSYLDEVLAKKSKKKKNKCVRTSD